MGTGQQPNPGHQYPQYQQQYAQQYQQQYQQYPQGYYQQGVAPGAPKQGGGRKGGVLIGILVTVLVLGLAFGGYWIWYLSSASDDSPPIDTSLDLADAPMGCGMFTESEIRQVIPGTFTTEGGGISGDRDYAKDAQCTYSNLDTFRDEGRPSAHISVTTRLHKADHPNAYRAQSGVDNAKEELGRKPGGAIGVPNATDDRFREIDGSGGGVAAAQLSVLYRNVIVTLRYSHDGLDEGQFTQPLLQLAQLAIKKIDPAAGQQPQPSGPAASSAPSLPSLPGG